jgi:hypothetical protein
VNRKQTITIEGTYQLVSRKLSNGTILRPPKVIGLLTFTKRYRNFNIMWKNSRGKILSLSYIATYKLTKSKYTEKSIYLMVNDQISNKGTKYDLKSKTASAPVTIKAGKIQFKLPHFDEPTLVFEKNKLAAQPPGFINHVDTWKRVD